MLKTRIVTAIFLLTGLILLLFSASAPVWSIAALIVTWLGAREWSGFIRLSETSKIFNTALFLLIGAGLIMLPKTSLSDYEGLARILILGLASFFWVVIAPIWLIRNSVLNSKWMMTALGMLMLMATCIALQGLREISPWLLLGTILTVSIADSAAYFAGKRFGKHKLAPEISPGKTWEGVYGALAAVTLYGAILCYTQNFSFWLIVSLWMLVALSVIGDLIESLMKRKAGVKDSGTLLPGHGGVLDRIDGMLPTLTVTLFCIYLALFNGLGLGR
ncbi:MAG: phosphatidate cytidylyltransferase [Methylotenera sp.]